MGFVPCRQQIIYGDFCRQPENKRACVLNTYDKYNIKNRAIQWDLESLAANQIGKINKVAVYFNLYFSY